MNSDSRLPWIIFAVLMVLILVPLGLWRLGEARRPVIEEVRVVTATDADPVFRTGLRRAPPGSDIRIAAAVRLSRVGDEDLWLAPVEQLVIDGEPVVHRSSGEWPDEDRTLRVFWFTVESAFLGGDLRADNAAKLLGQRTYLAPEMGRGLMARTVPEQHNDDQINLGDEAEPVTWGTIRLYAKVEIAKRAGAIATEQSAASPGLDAAWLDDYTSLRMAADLPEPIDPSVGELFRLPGFEPKPGPDELWNAITAAALDATFTELVDRRFVVSSLTFASVAVTGGAGMTGEDLVSLGRLSLDDDRIERKGRPVRWGEDVQPGDLLEDRSQWIVLLGDDGDGLLGRGDRVAHSWRRPAVVTVLDRAVRNDADGFELKRHER